MPIIAFKCLCFRQGQWLIISWTIEVQLPSQCGWGLGRAPQLIKRHEDQSSNPRTQVESLVPWLRVLPFLKRIEFGSQNPHGNSQSLSVPVEGTQHPLLTSVDYCMQEMPHIPMLKYTQTHMHTRICTHSKEEICAREHCVRTRQLDLDFKPSIYYFYFWMILKSKLGMATHVYSPSTGEIGQGDPWGLLAHQFRLIRVPSLSEKPCLKKRVVMKEINPKLTSELT